MSDHVDSSIQARLDGELSTGDTEAVDSHCRSCERCHDLLMRSTTLRERLRADLDTGPLTPMWPAVEEKLHGAEGFSVPFAIGTSAAAVAGIAIGVLLGSVSGSSYSNGEQDVWSEVGTTMTVESSPGLSGFYLDTGERTDS